MQLTRAQAETYRDAGVALLDQQQPGWAAAINLAELEMSDCTRCVLGQIYGNFGVGTDTLWPIYVIQHQKATAHGFDLPPADHSVPVSVLMQESEANWAILRDVWTALIAARQAAAVPTEEVVAV